MTKFVLLFTCLLFASSMAFAHKLKVIIDADTGNEIDDVPAIALALLSGKLDVIGITAAQWNRVEVCHRNTMLESWELNNQILQLLNMTHISSLKGAEEMVGKQWDIQPPRPSPAADFIIEQALAVNGKEKLIIICTGTATNVASAIMLEPKIVNNIAVYFIGTNYVFERKAVSKNEFNVRNDLNAFDVLLNTKGLELHIMPANVTKTMIFSKKETFQRLRKSKGIENLVMERWELIARDFEQWIMWDIALLQAVMHPQWAKEVIHDTPPENTPRKIYLYTQIDHEKMLENFWQVFQHVEQ